MLKEGVGYQLFPLQSGGNDNPSLTQGNPTSFALDAVPIVNGNRANYLLGVICTIAGVFVQAGTLGSEVFWDNFFQTLLQSVEVRNAWHGSPLNAQHALGTYWPILEYVSCGFRYASRRRGSFPATAASYAFSYTFMVPLCRGTNAKPIKTAQLQLLYKKAQLVLNIAGSGVASATSTGSSLTTLTCRASAVLQAHRSIWLAPGLEWVDYQNTASATQTQIPLLNFGNTTNLNGTKPNAGIAFLGAITSVNQMPGSFTADAVTQYQFPFLGQYLTQHMPAVLAQQLMSMGAQRTVGATHKQQALTDDQPNDVSGFPYILDTDNFSTSAATGKSELLNLMFFPLVTQAEDGQDSKVWQAYGDQSYNLIGPTFSGTNHTLAQHLRAWEDSKEADFAAQVIASGLAQEVLGTSDLEKRKAPHDKGIANIDAGKARYFETEYSPKGTSHVA
ncbi:MAG TPA: hypothetical protein VK688_01005 [Gemmatimonadales bacterium]|jgi:hypothetical protein|nr:hypothetical protein [Gemmatimonadales bacterium]